MEKVILISIDGMRPDGFLACGNPYVEELQRISAYTLDGQTVRPSMTMPCHQSMFHSVPPERHGIMTNTFTPFARPVDGIFEVIKNARGLCSMHYGWEPLRDLSVPSTVKWADMIRFDVEEDTDRQLTDRCLWRLRHSHPDFVFLYLGQTDDAGHKFGWMSEEYLRRISIAIDCVRDVITGFGDEYSILITADHGGHDRSHGQGTTPDVTIPQFYIGQRFTPGKVLHDVSVMDIPPTIADIMGLRHPPEWEGVSHAE